MMRNTALGMLDRSHRRLRRKAEALPEDCSNAALRELAALLERTAREHALMAAEIRKAVGGT